MKQVTCPRFANMSVSFTFQTVGKILFGVDTLNGLAGEVRRLGRRALLIAGRHAIGPGGPIETVRAQCREAGVDSVRFEPPPAGEPDLELVDRVRAFRAEAKCDVLVGLGGGSVIDAAKAAAGLANEAASVREYFDGRPVETRGVPWIAVPTTAGAGAEVTKNAVLSDPSRRMKTSLRDEKFYADAVIVDPRLTLSCPPATTAESGMDALVQAVESYTSLGANPMTDGLAFEAARLILAGLPAAWRNGADLEARSDVALGALLAGVALANARLGAVHGLAHPLGIRWDLPHGRVCATLLAPVMRFNESVVGDKYQRLGAVVGRPIIEHVEQLAADLGIPADFRSCRITDEELQWVIENSLPAGSMKMNPRPVTADDLREILAPLV